MKPHLRLSAGFYWVRFEGQVIVAEYSPVENKCGGCPLRGKAHWHVPASSAPFEDRQLCEIFGEPIPRPKSW